MDSDRRKLSPKVALLNWVRFAFLSAMFGSGWASAVEILRGPYLQLKTPHSIRILWRTDEPSPSIVFFGRDPAFLYQVTGALDSVTDHEVEILGLEPAKRYYYSVGSLFEAIAGGPEYFFETAPPEGQAAPTRIWAIGDSGTKKLATLDRAEKVRDAYLELAKKRSTDVWLALGDNAYYYGEDAEYQTQFFEVYPTLLRNAAIWSTLGNHETYSQENDGILPYFKIFSLPTRGEAGGVPSGTERYYSFNHANIHFVCLDSEISPYTGLQPMLSWLQADLAANTNLWLIGFWHSPPYSAGSHNSDGEYTLAAMRQFVVPVLESYGVDLILSGHSHIYERSFFLHGHYGNSTTYAPEHLVDGGNGRSDEDGAYQKTSQGPRANQGTVYVVAGSSGWVGPASGRNPAIFLQELEAGSMVIDVDGPTLTARFLRETGVFDDHFTLVKSDETQPLRLLKLQLSSQGTSILWRSQPGERYQVQSSDELSSDAWQDEGAVISSTGFTSSYSGELRRERRAQFYRIIKM